MLEERRHRLALGPGEEDADDLLQRLALRRGARGGGHVDVAQPFLAVANETLGLELDEHRPHGGIARRVVQAAANVLGGTAIAEREQDIHDLAFAAAQLFMRWRHHIPSPTTND